MCWLIAFVGRGRGVASVSWGELGGSSWVGSKRLVGVDTVECNEDSNSLSRKIFEE